MNLDLIYRQLTPKDLPEISRLLKTCFDSNNPNFLTHIQWKLPPFVGYGAFNKTELVSFYCSHRLDVSYQNSIFKSGICLDMATDPQFRGQKHISHLSHQLYSDLTKARYDFNFGFSNANGIKVDRHSRSYGYQVVGEMATYIAVPTFGQSTYHTKHVKQLIGSSYPLDYFHLPHTLQYLRWRYVTKPNHQYHYYSVYQATHLVAQIVTTETSLKTYVLKIIPHQQLDYQQLFMSIRRVAFTQRKLIVSFTCLPNDLLSNALKRAHFKRLPAARNPYYFTLKVLGARSKLSPKLTNPNNWFLTGGDIL